MHISIERKMQNRQYEYVVSGMPKVKLTANFTYGLFFRHISITDGTRSYAFRQRQAGKRLLGNLPFVSCVYVPPFVFYENGMPKGETVGRVTNPYFFDLGENWIERYAHANTSISYLQNGVQVALSTKRQPVYCERPVYDVALDENMVDPLLLLLLIALADVVSSPFSASGGWSFSRREYALHKEEKAYAPRLLWRPPSAD